MEKIILFSIKTIKNLLKEAEVRPSKWLGQNFLISQKTVQEIIKAAEISKQDVVLEIGPGIGNLTRELAGLAKKVVAVEKDRKMVEILRETMKEFKNVEIVEGDILKLKPQALNPNDQSNPKSQIPKNKNWSLVIGHWSFKVVANLPYYITSPVIRMFLEMENPPKIMVLMVQKEVGQRICALPRRSPDSNRDEGGQTRMSKLSVFVQSLAEPKIVKLVKKENFWPKPKVDSAILKITPLPGAEIRKNKGLQKLFSTVVNAGFSQPRKKLINNLSRNLNLPKDKMENWLAKNNISPNQRAESLSINDWLGLARTFIN